MARSSYIYILYNTDGAIIGAFTVKHEMMTQALRLGAGFYERHRDNQPEIPATVHNFITP